MCKKRIRILYKNLDSFVPNKEPRNWTTKNVAKTIKYYDLKFFYG